MIEILLLILILFAIFGGFYVSPLVWLLILVVILVYFFGVPRSNRRW